MKYEVLFDLEYYNGSNGSEKVTFETFGKGKKVLKAKIKKYVEGFYKEPEKLYNVRIVYIKRFESIRPYNVWPREEFEKLNDKLYHENYG
jgi:hypothetical protein